MLCYQSYIALWLRPKEWRYCHSDMYRTWSWDGIGQFYTIAWADLVNKKWLAPEEMKYVFLYSTFGAECNSYRQQAAMALVVPHCTLWHEWSLLVAIYAAHTTYYNTLLPIGYIGVYVARSWCRCPGPHPWILTLVAGGVLNQMPYNIVPTLFPAVASSHGLRWSN